MGEASRKIQRGRGTGRGGGREGESDQNLLLVPNGSCGPKYPQKERAASMNAAIKREKGGALKVRLTCLAIEKREKELLDRG